MANNDYSSRWRFRGYYASNSYYIPQCSSDGTFLPIQCSTPNDTLNDKQYCWCVDPVTGIAVQSDYDPFDDDYLFYSDILFPPEVISNVTCKNVDTTAICKVRENGCTYMCCTYVNGSFNVIAVFIQFLQLLHT